MQDSTKLAVGLLIAVLIAAVAYFIFSHAAPKPAFDSITPGMSMAEVARLVGPPHGIRPRSPASNTAYCYGGFRSGKWCTMEVYFGPDNHVLTTFHDH